MALYFSTSLMKTKEFNYKWNEEKTKLMKDGLPVQVDTKFDNALKTYLKEFKDHLPLPPEKKRS